MLLFPLSADSPAELAAAAMALADSLRSGGSLPELARTLADRPHLPERAVAVATDRHQLESRLRALTTLQPGTGTAVGTATTSGAPVWVFSGHGSQWAGMGRALLAREPVFAESVGRIEPLVAAEAGFSVRRAITGDQPVTGVERVQPTLFAMQVALAEVWRAHGPEPAAVIGHSMGEVAAAVVSGALSLEQGVAVICRRSRLMAGLTDTGAMAVVTLPGEQVQAELGTGDDVVVAVHSSPESCVVAGAPERVRELVAEWEARGLLAREVAVEVASHSSRVDPVVDELTAALAALRPGEPAVPLFSTVLDDPCERPEFDAAYWAANLRQPVRFAGAVSAALSHGHDLFIEISPHPLLVHPLRQNIAAAQRDAVVLHTLRRGGDAQLRLRAQLGALHCAGAELDWERICSPAEPVHR